MASGNIPPEFLPSLISGQHGFPDVTISFRSGMTPIRIPQELINDIAVPHIDVLGGLSLTPTYPYDLISGSILSGYLSTHAVDSGVISSLNWDIITTSATGRDNNPYRRDCDRCGNLLGERYISVITFSDMGRTESFCGLCAGYSHDKGGFGWQREEWIRKTYAFPKDTPAGIIADYLEDHGRTEDAEYLRSRSSR